MTWIRVDTTLPTERVIGQLCERLEVEPPTALGLYVGTQLGFGDHQKDGMVAPVPSVTLEQWAGWRGEPGAWAAAFRDLCVETQPEHRDPVGCINGWWRNEALFRKAARDAQRGRGEEDDEGDPPSGPPNVSADPALEPRGNAAGSARHVAAAAANEDGNEQQHLRAAPVSSLDYVRRVVGAANRGLQANPAYKGRGRGFNELTCSAQDAHLAWIKDGIPVALAERVIFDRAKRYRPSTHRPQPGALAYFDRGVREAWDRELSHLASAGLQVQSSTGEALTEAEQLARRYEAEALTEQQEAPDVRAQAN